MGTTVSSLLKPDVIYVAEWCDNDKKDYGVKAFNTAKSAINCCSKNMKKNPALNAQVIRIETDDDRSRTKDIFWKHFSESPDPRELRRPPTPAPAPAPVPVSLSRSGSVVLPSAVVPTDDNSSV